MATQAAPGPGPNSARFQVEFVLRDKKHWQPMDLGKTNGLWRIDARGPAAGP